MSAHLISTILGIPSGPGALNGRSLAMCFLIWSFVMGFILHIRRGRFASSVMLSVCWGFLGKKVFASATLLLMFVLAVCSPSGSCIVRNGILVFPPSLAGAEMYLCAVQRSGSVAFSSQSRQWCFLEYWIVLLYFFCATMFSS